MLDPAPAMRLPRKLLRSVTWLTPNETESATLLGDSGEREGSDAIADRILSLGCRNVVLKLGAKGVFLAGKDTARLAVKGFKVKPVDTTAAGDAFNGAFAMALVRHNAEDAARFACAVAAISVTGRSTAFHAVLQRGRSIPATAELKLANGFQCASPISNSPG